MKIRLERVQYMPKQLQPGVLYVAEQFGAAAHLCACGCGSKIRTPLGPTDWKLHDTAAGPSLWPSIGSWQLPCRSHYWIRRGEIEWSGDWSEEEIADGRRMEERRNRAYYEAQTRSTKGFLKKLWRGIKRFFNQ